MLLEDSSDAISLLKTGLFQTVKNVDYVQFQSPVGSGYQRAKEDRKHYSAVLGFFCIQI